MQNSNTATHGDPFLDESAHLGEKISESATQLKDNVSDFGRKAANKIDENVSYAATGLDKAAAALHGKAENLPGSEQIGGLAHSTAEKFTATADYLRAHDVNTVMKDVKGLVVAHPGRSLLVAGAVGFVLARTFMGRNRD